jgi:hypothetical protein
MLLQTAKPAGAAGDDDTLSQPDTQIPALGGDQSLGKQLITYSLKLR